MKTIDISQSMINIRQKNKMMENEFSSNTPLPSWMKEPLDNYFSTNSLSSITDSNIIHGDFSKTTLQIPKALAAATIGSEKLPWHDQSLISFKDSDGAILAMAFNKSSDTSDIELTVNVTQGESLLLHYYCGQFSLKCSLFDGEKRLAALTATVNHNGTFFYAEGTVLDDHLSDDHTLDDNESINSGNFIALHFH